MPRSRRATFWRRSLIVLGVMLLVGAAAARLMFPTQYTAFALLRVSSSQPAVLKERARVGTEFDLFKATQAQLISSSVVLNRVLRDPSINRRPSVVEHEDDQVSWLKGQLMVEYPGENEVMRIGIETNSKADSIQLVNKVVDVYLKEIVEHEKALRMANEAKIQRAYEQMTADYTRGLNALVMLEKNFGTSGSHAAQIKKKVAIEELDMLIADSGRLTESLRENALEIELNKARAEISEKERKASMISLGSEVEDTPLSLPLLEKKREFLQRELAETSEKIEAQASEVSGIESFHAQVTAKQEELEGARLLKNQLGAEVERIRIERLAADRIVKLEDAALESEAGDAMKRNLLCGILAAVGLAVLGLGLVIGRPRPLESADSIT